MSYPEFLETLENDNPPVGMSAPLQALWHDGRGDWESAHRKVQDENTEDGAWVHAYLHRKEGDDGNAAYWYHRAGKPMATGSLQEEWEALARTLLGKQ